MTDWLSAALCDDLQSLTRKVWLPGASEQPDENFVRRTNVVQLSATLPGLRMCERRRCIILAQSAPTIDVVLLTEVLSQLHSAFLSEWSSLKGEAQEKILSRCRLRLTELSIFASQLAGVLDRRRSSSQFLQELDGVEALPTTIRETAEPIYPYLGHEVEVLLPALRTVTYPTVLQRRDRRDRESRR
jgi:hypothetical protein